MNLPNPTAPLVARVRRLHGAKTMRDHVARVRAIREAVRRKVQGKKGVAE